MKNNRIFPECNAETFFTSFLGFEGPNHEFGFGGVKNAFTIPKHIVHNDFAIGLIDNDRRKPENYYNWKTHDNGAELQFRQIQSFIETINTKKFGFELYRRDNQDKHYLVVIHPAFERWIINEAKKASISINDFIIIKDSEGMQIDLMDYMNLKRYVTESIEFSIEHPFKSFLIALHQKAPLPFDTIRDWCQAVLERKPIVAD